MSTALLRLVDIGWVESYDESTEENALQTKDVIVKIPHPDATIPHPDAEECLRARENGKEWNRREEEEPPNPPACSPAGERITDAQLSLIPAPTNGTLKAHQGEWFNAWWKIYWRRVSRKQAEKAFQKHVRSPARFEEVMAATKHQTSAMMAREPDHRPHGATWLNAERWEDEPSLPSKGPPGRAGSFTDSVSRAMERRVEAGMKPL